MRQVISGMIAAIAVVAAGTVPASACGFDFGCGPVVAPVYSGCNTGCGGWAVHERLPDPDVQYHAAPIATPQYYYVNQGPTYSGPGNFAPRRYYQEGGVYGWPHHHHHYGYRHYGYGYHAFHHGYRYGYHPHVLHSYY